MRDWLVSLRIVKGFTQNEVATKCGISRSYYSGIENGTRNAKPSTAKEIANVLGFDWTIFFEKNGRISSHKGKSA